MSEKLIRVLIDGRKIGPNGIGVYTENLIAANVNQENLQIGVILSPKLQSETELSKYSWYSRVDKIWYHAGLYSLSEYFLLGRLINKGQWDIYHSPHYTLPFGIKTKTIVTVHDLIHISHPEKWYYPFVAKILVSSALNRANLIISVSQASKSDLLKIFPKIKKNIRVIPNIIDQTFDLSVRELKKEKYFMAVISTWKPHKGLKFLIEAFEKFSEKNNNYRLILVGSGIARGIELGEVDRLSIKFKNKISFLGRVSNSELQNLYSKASAVCVASTIEGFCLPFIEAHANFCPVLFRPVPALQELKIEHFDLESSDWSVGAYADLFERFVEQLSERVEYQSKYAELIKQQLRQFSKEVVAKQLNKIYSEVADLNV
jgi:glycosyltransferase involved in cell wall biosynthesis